MLARLCLLAMGLLAYLASAAKAGDKSRDLYSRDNLVAWCIVPFDAKKRGPQERAEMLARLGFKRFAYDWRGEHIPTFAKELNTLKKHGIRLEAFWFPAALNDDARKILDALKANDVKTQLWITMGDPAPKAKDDEEKTAAAARILTPIVEEAARIGCTVALYNHGGWFGEPENQTAIIERLKSKHVGIVYNLHHGHDHLERFPALLKKMLPHLWCLNLNGMVKDGDKVGKKILPLGQGERDLALLRTIRDSGYRGPIGILGHTMDDAEERLRDNLDGLDWLLPQLDGKTPGPRPKLRTYKTSDAGGENPPYSDALVKQLLAESKGGDARHGVAVFRAPQFACLGCHKVGKEGGAVGPDLTLLARCLKPEEIVEAVLWPKRHVKDEYKAVAVITQDGIPLQGYKVKEDDKELTLRDPATGKTTRLAKADIAERRDIGSLMPDGLTAAMTPMQRRDLLRFLLELGKTEGLADLVHAHAHAVASFPVERAPLLPEHWPHWKHHVNRDRLYDFYAREADYFAKQPSVPPLLPEFPGLDGGKLGHWGNQNEKVWADDRWNQADIGTLLSGVFRAPGLVVPRGVCVRLGKKGELAACFNPDTLCYEAVWAPPEKGNFVKFSAVRHGFMDGLVMNGAARPRPEGTKPKGAIVYHGFHRHGSRVLFSYSIDGIAMLDAPWVEDGKFTRIVAPADKHPLAKLTDGGPVQWPQVLDTRGTLGDGGPYVVDTIAPPFDNPWKAPLFFGGHDFLADGSALLCTMQGDVWRVEGLDDKLERVRWRRFASGLHQALGLVVAGDKIYVLGRDQITRLHDKNGDGEADYYECISNAYHASPGGHDYICGLERDAAGNFYTASSKQGLIRIAPDGKKVDVLAVGFRNPDGLGLYPDASLTVPCSEGEWTPASMLCLVEPERKKGTSGPPRIGGHHPPYFGYGGPRDGRPPDLPLVYLPRGLDNSAGGQVFIAGDRWGPLQGKMVHFSFGAGSHFLLLRDEAPPSSGGDARTDQPQGAVVPLPGEFLSGAHRGRFSPKDGQLYVSGMAGWGTYTLEDGCFQRIRYTGKRMQLPAAYRVHENGVWMSFTAPVDKKIAGDVKSHFAQAWNYRYSAGYGSPEFSPRHPGTRGHDHQSISAVHLLPDGKSLFLEMPDLQPVNQLHLRLRVEEGAAVDLFATVHRLGPAFSDFPGFTARPRVVAAHPILVDLAATAKSPPNPWGKALAKARKIGIVADKNLTFAQRTLTVKAGEVIKLNFQNPDEVPHNWVLIKPGSLERVGSLANRLIAEPDAAVRHYVPKSDDVLLYTDIVPPHGDFSIWFQAPKTPGRYPYLCTFPGHWMVMNGTLIVE